MSMSKIYNFEKIADIFDSQPNLSTDTTDRKLVHSVSFNHLHSICNIVV